MTQSRFYITTAISYPNGAPHIGHAYEAVATDAIARFKRIDGFDVFFLTGVDEHGLKILQTAAKEGITPRQLCDRNTPMFVAMCDKLAISRDRFIRTTEPANFEASQALWRRMLANGDIYLGTYSGWYSVRDEAFYDESETQVAEGGARLGPQGTPVEWTQEKTYFFRLSAYQDRLLRYYEAHPEFIGPETRRNEVLSFVRGGLQDLSISRSTLSWGVPVPDAPGHVMYVWVDALTSYITAVEFPDEKAANWRYWPADFHIIGKDIVRFHAVYWPAFLMSAGVAVPKRIFGHGFLFNRGEKMSKSVGNVIDPVELADAYGVDQLRYFFLREVAFGQDGSYSHEAIVSRINADLANDLGNLAQRSLSMVARDCKGLVPSPGVLSDADIVLLAEVDALPARLRKSMGELALHVALAEIWNLVGATNRYFASEEPWAKRKSDPARFATILHVTLEALRAIGITTQPFIPSAAAKLLELLGVSPHLRSLQDVGARGRTEAGRVLPAPVPIFPRYVDPEAPAAGAAR